MSKLTIEQANARLLWRRAADKAVKALYELEKRSQELGPDWPPGITAELARICTLHQAADLHSLQERLAEFWHSAAPRSR